MSRIVHLHMDEVGFISQWRAILAGGLAGVAAALLTYPLEVAETRLIAQNCRQPTYIGVVHSLSKIYKHEGLRALYRGFSLTLLGVFACSYKWVHFLWVVLRYQILMLLKLLCFSFITLWKLVFMWADSDGISCNLHYISFICRCFPLFYRMLCGPHELGQALAGASFSLHSPPELH